MKSVLSRYLKLNYTEFCFCLFPFPFPYWWDLFIYLFIFASKDCDSREVRAGGESGDSSSFLPSLQRMIIIFQLFSLFYTYSILAPPYDSIY